MRYFTNILILCGLLQSISGCDFEGLIAQCGMHVGGIDLTVRANINHCSTPIDVTFLVQNAKHSGDSMHEEGSYKVAVESPDYQSDEPTKSSQNVFWKYTFVTTNMAETREIPGFDDSSRNGRVLLHIFANTTTNTKFKRSLGDLRMVDLKAQFSVDGQTDPNLMFLDEQVRINHFDDCAGLQYEAEINLIAVSTIVVISVLGLLSLVGLCVYKHRIRSTEDELDLMANMQQPSPTRPYNLTTPEQRSEFHRRQPSIHLDMVHYVVPAPNPAGEDEQKLTSKDDYGDTKDLKLYVSTSTGLKKLKQEKSKSVQFSGKEDGHDSVDEEELPPPPLPRKPQIQDPMTSSKKGGFLDVCSSPTSSESTSSMCSSSDRSLGAIPKKRNANSSSNNYESSSTGKSGRSRKNRLDEKCRRAAAGSSPISSSSSSGTSVSR